MNKKANLNQAFKELRKTKLLVLSILRLGRGTGR